MCITHDSVSYMSRTRNETGFLAVPTVIFPTARVLGYHDHVLGDSRRIKPFTFQVGGIITLTLAHYY